MIAILSFKEQDHSDESMKISLISRNRLFDEAQILLRRIRLLLRPKGGHDDRQDGLDFLWVKKNMPNDHGQEFTTIC